MSFINRTTNVFSPRNMARVAHNCGLEKLSLKILENNYGKQYGKTAQSGLRAFMRVDKSGDKHIELIGKDFTSKGYAHSKGDKDSHISQFQRWIFDNDKTIYTSMLKVKNPIPLFGSVQQDVRYSHFISEHGPNIKQRTGKWHICLPNSKKVIEKNEGGILDYLL